LSSANYYHISYSTYDAKRYDAKWYRYQFNGESIGADSEYLANSPEASAAVDETDEPPIKIQHS
jgi:hypothetical protein